MFVAPGGQDVPSAEETKNDVVKKNGLNSHPVAAIEKPTGKQKKAKICFSSVDGTRAQRTLDMHLVRGVKPSSVCEGPGGV